MTDTAPFDRRDLDFHLHQVNDAAALCRYPRFAEHSRDTFDAVLVVDAPHELQVERMVRDRGWTLEDAESRIAAQASREDRLAVATHVVENTGTREDLRTRVAEVFADVVSAERPEG